MVWSLLRIAQVAGKHDPGISCIPQCFLATHPFVPADPLTTRLSLRLF
ncbi:MAG: hypothetical protein M2R45_04261 [Verrucomicrobia subdivision 3 bacterium]|nr:hypothetical protein [Limisphaerales bacterium]MCS1412612.1 hypothetical protein [Limisphaerales bacterium]